MDTDLYSVARSALLGLNRRLNIVVVGANDGRINDPIYDFVSANPSRTSVLLIEPNTALVPFLEQNYSFHPLHKIVNCAVGKPGVLTLYAIREDCWKLYQPIYASGWPLYRAPTGITSGDRAHVERHLKNENVNPEDAIHSLHVPCRPLENIVAELRWPIPIDILQIDAEGCDDSIIYACNLESTRPKIIYFESGHIPEGRMNALLAYLSKHDYRTYDLGANSLSIESRANLPSACLNAIALVLRAATGLVRRYSSAARTRYA